MTMTIIAQQRLGEPTAPTSRLLLLELVDQIDQVEEPAARTAANDRGCHANAEMRFAGARAADENCVALGIEERAGCEFAHLSLVNHRVAEDELVEILQHRELGAADAIAD